ncbi:hypothetical protein BDV96DRAFT_605673 [Lophiotrema nucula]|uniref:Heterokaryon incompatibility domain-containing protein n=1 Tax=Lophiotrema nucula TaxID=690887 RepID=A0A6A5YMD4_9PLEO|nr:hypothetical protein BDV96DRAFT_605673 [Lophiotrema nucula]
MRSASTSRTRLRRESKFNTWPKSIRTQTVFCSFLDAILPAVEFIYDFLSQYGWEFNELRGDFPDDWLNYSADDLAYEYDIPLPGDDEWIVVRALLSSPIFRRTWIVQEIILAREVRIMIEELEYPFDMDGSLGFRTFLGMHNQRSLSPVVGRYLGPEADDVMTLLRDRLTHRHLPGDASRALLPLLSEIRTFGATDPRDKVYAQALLHAISTRLGSSSPRIKASTSFFAKKRCGRSTACPPGFPDWSCSVLEKFGNFLDEDEKMFNATKGLRLTIQEFEDVKKLRIQGIYSSITIGVVDDKLTGMIDDWYNHADGHGENDKNCMKRYGLMEAKFYEVREDELRKGGYSTDEETRDMIRMTGAVGTMASYRVLFTTGEKYMGLAPLTARIGDVIYLLPGVDVPLVLRNVWGDEYELIGQCYTHGIMYGERADSKMLQNITLL